LKLFITKSLWNALLLSQSKEKLEDILQHHLSLDHNFYTSTYSVDLFLSELGQIDAEKKKILFHLTQEIVDEMIPLKKEHIAQKFLNSEFGSKFETELSIANLESMDQIFIFSELKDTSAQGFNLTIRNLFWETKSNRLG